MSNIGDEALLRFLSEKLISVTGIQYEGPKDQPGKPHRFCFSGMIMSFEEEWFLVTAGHCLKDLDKAIESSQVDGVSIIDYLGENAKHYMRLPFDYANSRRWYDYKVNGYDVGIIYLRDFYRRQLGTNKVPVDEAGWRRQPTDYFLYMLIGTPYAYIDGVEIEKAVIQPCGIKVIRLTSTPQVFQETSGCDPDEVEDNPEIRDAMFYGVLSQDADLPRFLDGQQSIVGMSGGPILGFAQIKDEVRYWPVAIQSNWHRPTRTIKATPVALFGPAIIPWLEYVRNSEQV